MVTCCGHSSTNIFQLLTLKMCTHIVQAEPYLSDINETNCLDWGVYDRGIEELAASACHDKHGRNRSRNLYSYIHKRKRTLPIQINAVDIPVRIRRPVKVVNKSWPVLHLSSWLKATMEDPKYGGFFFLGGKTLDNMDEVRRMFSTFWTRYDKTHPGSMPALPETTIPILIHGDEGRSLCKRPVMIVSFQCIIPWCGENIKNSSQMLAYASLKHFVSFCDFNICLVKMFPNQDCL